MSAPNTGHHYRSTQGSTQGSTQYRNSPQAAALCSGRLSYPNQWKRNPRGGRVTTTQARPGQGNARPVRCPNKALWRPSPRGRKKQASATDKGIRAICRAPNGPPKASSGHLSFLSPSCLDSHAGKLASKAALNAGATVIFCARRPVVVPAGTMQAGDTNGCQYCRCCNCAHAEGTLSDWLTI